MNDVTVTLGDYSAYSKFKYPAGEMQVRLTENTLSKFDNNWGQNITLVARIYTSEDVMETMLLCSALCGAQNAKFNNYNLVLPYLPYSRADRRFVKGDCLGKAVFLYILQSYIRNDWTVTTLDEHSNKYSNGEITNVSPMSFIEKTIKHFAEVNNSTNLVLLFPDEGAHKRYNVGKVEGINLKYLYCEKTRDASTGKLSGFKVPELSSFCDSDSKPYPTLIVDDISDGGGTFIGIAEELVSYGLNKALYITHGIFSKGTDELFKHFDRIYTTNSFKEHQPNHRLAVYDCLPLLTS